MNAGETLRDRIREEMVKPRGDEDELWLFATTELRQIALPAWRAAYRTVARRDYCSKCSKVEYCEHVPLLWMDRDLKRVECFEAREVEG